MSAVGQASRGIWGQGKDKIWGRPWRRPWGRPWCGGGQFSKKEKKRKFQKFLIIIMLPIILDYWALVENNVFRI